MSMASSRSCEWVGWEVEREDEKRRPTHALCKLRHVSLYMWLCQDTECANGELALDPA